MDELTATLHASRAYWHQREAARLRLAGTVLRSAAQELCMTSRALCAQSRELREGIGRQPSRPLPRLA